MLIRGVDVGSAVGGWRERGGSTGANREAVSNNSTVELFDRVVDGPPNKHKHKPWSMSNADTIMRFVSSKDTK